MAGVPGWGSVALPLGAGSRPCRGPGMGRRGSAAVPRPPRGVRRTPPQWGETRTTGSTSTHSSSSRRSVTRTGSH